MPKNAEDTRKLIGDIMAAEDAEAAMDVLTSSGYEITMIGAKPKGEDDAGSGDDADASGGDDAPMKDDPEYDDKYGDGKKSKLSFLRGKMADKIA